MTDLYQPTGPEELSRRFLRDVELAGLSYGQEIPVRKGSDFWLTSQGLAGIALLGFSNIAISESDQSVLSSTGQALDNIREGYGIAEVTPTAAAGKIVLRISGTTTVPNNQVFLYPSGASGRIISQYINPSDYVEVDVVADKPGSDGNLKSGETVRLVNPPINVGTEAKVSQSFPIVGGTDVESDARKRLRILNVLRNKPAGGNWAYIRDLVLSNFGGIQECYVYPALGGPASVKVVIVKDFNSEISDYSRSVSSALMNAVRNFLQSKLPVAINVIVSTPASQYADSTLLISIPNSSQSGGNGRGWLDVAPWPALTGPDNGRVTLSSPSATFDSFTLSAQTSSSPINGQTHISWWSSSDRKFYSALVVGSSGVAGARVVNLDRPLVDSNGLGPVDGDYVSPTCYSISEYGAKWIQMFSSFGPGENTTGARLPRAARKPTASETGPSSITNASVKIVTNAHPEITDFSFGYNLITSPAVPGSTNVPPNILVPRKFGVYPQ